MSLKDHPSSDRYFEQECWSVSVSGLSSVLAALAAWFGVRAITNGKRKK